MSTYIRPAVLAVATTVLLGAVAGCGGQQALTGREGSRHDDAAAQRGPSARTSPQKPFTMVATGDILSHDSVIRQAREDAAGSGYDFRRMLAGAKSLASGADLAICHMETVYGRSGGPFTGYPAFKTPPDVAAAVKDTGYESCSSASNHSMDDGVDGVRRTITAMDKAGLKHAGSADSARARGHTTMMRAGGAKVAQLAYTYGTNDIPVPKNRRWAVNLIDPKRIIADARAARRAGADIVVTSMHWGTEWQEEPDGDQKRLARQLTRSRDGSGRKDIDLIIGTHAHVPQAYEKVNGTWVVYGMGDQLAGKMNDPRGSMSSAARFTFVPPKGGSSKGGGAPKGGAGGSAKAKGAGDARDAKDAKDAKGARSSRGAAGQGRQAEWSVKRAEYIPFFVQTTPRISVVDLGRENARDAGSGRAEAFRTIRDAVLSRGADKQGLRMGR
ncbi:poly-gamma-glutamate synthesis protein (capsule biosynthesis protein) [Streptomyces sp. Amel2xB2]|uniref:CapA family protein n=1 Tax=Streptomyces sp. Amel2xB2 TaxID=1305829 RepID=UPI000DB95E4A|nr:poly-gamma-glutamate synthesis protein (capsule biosynthesis protein) [Streptomyces sp. Amel2xB2]